MLHLWNLKKSLYGKNSKEIQNSISFFIVWIDNSIIVSSKTYYFLRSFLQLVVSSNLNIC